MSNFEKLGEPYWQTTNGDIRLYDIDAFEALNNRLPENSIPQIWTDPPYFLSNGGSTCSRGKRVSVNKGGWDASEGIASDHQRNLDWLSAGRRCLSKNGSIWVSGTSHIYFSLGFGMQSLGYKIINDVVWEKPAPPPNLGCRSFTHSAEMLIWAHPGKKDGKYTFNYELMRSLNSDKQMKSVWEINPPHDWEKRYGKHPTQKPVELVSRCLLASTNPGDLVLDPFAGSCTTAITCVLLGRKFIGFEKDPVSLELATKRLNGICQKDGCYQYFTQVRKLT